MYKVNDLRQISMENIYFGENWFFSEETGENKRGKLHMKEPPKPIPLYFVKKALNTGWKNGIELCIFLFSSFQNVFGNMSLTISDKLWK